MEFEITELNPDGKKFEKVDRVMAKGDDVDLLLDVHGELFEVAKDDKLAIQLQKTKPNDLSKFDYAMFGTVYSYKVKGTKIEVHLSHGGLLARLVGLEEHLGKLEVDVDVYTLVKKV